MVELMLSVISFLLLHSALFAVPVIHLPLFYCIIKDKSTSFAPSRTNLLHLPRLVTRCSNINLLDKCYIFVLQFLICIFWIILDVVLIWKQNRKYMPKITAYKLFSVRKYCHSLTSFINNLLNKYRFTIRQPILRSQQVSFKTVTIWKLTIINSLGTFAVILSILRLLNTKLLQPCVWNLQTSSL